MPVRNPKLRAALLATALALPPTHYHEAPGSPKRRKASGKNRDKIKAARKQRHQSK